MTQTKTVAGYLAVFAATLAVGCGGGGAQVVSTQGMAQVRVVQENDGAPTVSVAVDGNVLTANLAYQGVSSYASVESGSRHVVVTTLSGPGMGTAIVDAMIAFSPDTNNTLIPEQSAVFPGPLHSVALDDPTPAADSQAKLRLLNISLTTQLLDLYVLPQGTATNGTPTLTALCTFPTCTADQQKYLILPPGIYDIDVTVSGTTQVIYSKTAVTLAAAQNRTLLIASNCPPCTGPVCSCDETSLTSVLLSDLN